MESSADYLIVGLGNPGSKYERTRHNLGFMVVEAFARKYSLSFKRGWRIQGKLVTGMIEEKKVHLLLPTTYMNLSGSAVRKAVHYYKIALKNLLVIVDDIYIRFGAMRLRSEGSAGGHNGLKNIQACLGTQDYPRLKMGVGPQEGEKGVGGIPLPLEEYVLANFTPSENQELLQVIEKGVAVAEGWLKLGEGAASELAGNLSKLGSQ